MKLAKPIYFVGFLVILSMFGFAYVIVTSQNAALTQARDSLKDLKDVKVDVCTYHGVRISDKCHTLEREFGLELFQAFLSSSPTRGPSKAKIIKDEIIIFTGKIAPNEGRRACFNAVVFESVSGKTYFSSFQGNRSCNEIAARQGGYLVADINIDGKVEFP